jgi:hypothetical protein
MRFCSPFLAVLGRVLEFGGRIGHQRNRRPDDWPAVEPRRPTVNSGSPDAIALRPLRTTTVRIVAGIPGRDSDQAIETVVTESIVGNRTMARDAAAIKPRQMRAAMM